MSQDRPYVEYGALACVPGPLHCDGSHLWCFLLRADHDKLATLLKKVFDEPSGGAVQVKPLIGHVMASFGVIDRIAPALPPFDRMGTAREPQVALWIPAVRVKDGVPQRFYVFVPYIWLDNPISLASGREVFGWSKSFGRPVLPQDGEPFSVGVDAYGMNYGKGEQPDFRRLITISGTKPHGGARETDAPRGDSLRSLAAHLAPHVRRETDERSLWPGLEFLGSLLEDLFEHRLQEIFLKQFRSISDGHRACLQQVVATNHMVGPGLRWEVMLDEFDVSVAALDSEPLADELGLEPSSRTTLGFKIDMDFVVEPGRVLWE